MRLVLANKRSTVHVQPSNKRLMLPGYLVTMQLEDTETPRNTCMGESVCLCVCVAEGGWCVWAQMSRPLRHTPPPTSRVGWCTRILRTQTGRSSWPHRYDKEKRLVYFIFLSENCLTYLLKQNEKERYKMGTYSSSGVSWMGSLVNWASKLSNPNSPEMLGLKGGTTCFCSSWNNNTGSRWELNNHICQTHEINI